MNDKLTPRQNELISEAICKVAIDMQGRDSTPEVLKTLRRALVTELEAVSSETTLSASGQGVRSICG
jgi:hypothetical protein